MDLTDLSGRRTVLVGAGTPIGDAVASRIYDAGSEVMLLGVGAAVWGSAAKIQGTRSVGSILCDHRNRDDLASGLHEAHERLGGIDVLVLVNDNDARGLNPSTDSFGLVVDSMRVAAERMRPGGRLVSIAPALNPLEAGDRVRRTIDSFGSRRVTAALALELATSGLSFNVIAPGYVVRAASDVRPDAGTADWRTPATPPPLGRWTTPADVANVALFLCSDWSAHVCGVDLAVDGGLHAITGI